MTGIYKENLRSFDKTMEEYSDVVLIINDDKFYVLKLYLATQSSYFNTLFLGISNETKKTEIQLSGIDSDDFQKYLEVLYGEQTIDETTVEGILMVADKYDTRVFIEKCENFLQKESKKRLKKKLELSSRYNLSAFTKFDSIQWKLNEMVETLKPEVSSEIDENGDFPVTTALVDSTQNFQENKELVSTSGKRFVLKHTFNNVSNFEDGTKYYSEIEEHFGVPWKKKERGGKDCDVFKSDDAFTASGYNKFIEWDELKKDFVVDDCFCVEISVKVRKMTGIYKENLRSFDNSMEEYSDVVLIVNDEKFYVSKLYLATHSPYFKTLFTRNSNNTEKSEIKLSGTDSDDFQKYLEVLYGEQAIDEATVEGILTVDDKYNTPVVIEKCENFLQNESKKPLKKKLQLSTRYNLAVLMKQCLGKIKSVSDIKSVIPGDVHDLDPSIATEILRKLVSLHNSNQI